MDAGRITWLDSVGVQLRAGVGNRAQLRLCATAEGPADVRGEVGGDVLGDTAPGVAFSRVLAGWRPGGDRGALGLHASGAPDYDVILAVVLLDRHCGRGRIWERMRCR